MRSNGGKEMKLFKKKNKKPESFKYRKKPVEIEAWQFTKDNFSKGVPEFIKRAESLSLYSQYGGEVIGGEIETLEGKMKVSENDYIIRGVQGEFYPCKPDIFEKTYDKV